MWGPGAPERTKSFMGTQPGKLQLGESSFVLVGLKLSQEEDSSARLVRLEFSPKLAPCRNLPIPVDDSTAVAVPRGCSSTSVYTRGTLFGCRRAPTRYLCSPRPTRPRSEFSQRGRQISYNDLIKTVRVRQPATVLKYVSEGGTT